MFFGEFEYKIDEKGRVPIPPRFKRGLKEGVVLTPAVEKCITAYPLSEWKKLAVCNFLVRMRFNGFRSEQAVRQQR
ncbi:Transcriptional regulator MraZ [subsurface metagenome]